MEEFKVNLLFIYSKLSNGEKATEFTEYEKSGLAKAINKRIKERPELMSSIGISGGSALIIKTDNGYFVEYISNLKTPRDTDTFTFNL